MRAAFNTSDLKTAVGAVLPLVAKKSPKAILQNVRLCVRDDGATVEANNSESAALYRFKTQASTDEEPGECLLPAERFSKLIRELNETEISIEAESKGADGSEVVVWAGKKRFKFDAADPAEFPVFPATTDGHRVAIPGKVLAEAIERTAFACDTDSHRYALQAVAFTMDEGGRLTLAATDSRVLSVYSVPTAEPDWEPGEKPVLIPGTVLTGVVKHLTDLEFAGIIATENAVQLNLGELTIYTRQIEGRFPPIQKFQEEPKETAGTSIMKVGELVRCIRQAQLFASEESSGIDFDFQPDSVVLATASSQVGAAKVQLSHEYDGGKPVGVTLEPSFLLHYFKGVDADEDVYVTLINAENQVRFRLGSVRDISLFVQMPLSKG